MWEEGYTCIFGWLEVQMPAKSPFVHQYLCPFSPLTLKLFPSSFTVRHGHETNFWPEGGKHVLATSGFLSPLSFGAITLKPKKAVMLDNGRAFGPPIYKVLHKITMNFPPI